MNSCRRVELSLLSLPPALSMAVAMAVYTSERWDQPPHPQIQASFSWSFYLGWLSAILLLCTGDYPVHCPGELGRANRGP